jgi:hypothetical protein
LVSHLFTITTYLNPESFPGLPPNPPHRSKRGSGLFRAAKLSLYVDPSIRCGALRELLAVPLLDSLTFGYCHAPVERKL